MKNFFYFVSSGKYTLCDVDACAKSERTIDINFFDLANNEALLRKLSLYYIQGNYGVTYTYKSRGEWFAGYIGSFTIDKGERIDKLKGNPIIRIIVEDKELLSDIKKIEINLDIK